MTSLLIVYIQTEPTKRQQGTECGKHQVARLRRRHDIIAKRRRRFIVTTCSKYTKWQAPNLLRRNFTTARPNRVWVGDQDAK